MYIMQNRNVCHLKSDGSYEGSVGAIKMVVHPDEHTQTNTRNGTQSPNVVLYCVQQETVVSHKMHVKSQILIFLLRYQHQASSLWRISQSLTSLSGSDNNMAISSNCRLNIVLPV